MKPATLLRIQIKAMKAHLLSACSAIKLPILFILPLFSACQQRTTVTVPRPVYAICAETPCRFRVEALRGTVQAGEKRPHNVLIDVQDFAARHPARSPFRLARDQRRKAAPGKLDLWIQTGRDSQRFDLNPAAQVTLTWLQSPQGPSPAISTVFRPRREAAGPFTCGARADVGTWFAVSWIPAVYPTPPIRKPSIVMETAPVWAPLQVFIPEGRYFVISRIPEARHDLWMALLACLGPVAVVDPVPGQVTVAQLTGVSLWQWARPEAPQWSEFSRVMRAAGNGGAAGNGEVVIAAAVDGRQFHAETVDGPVDFLYKMLLAGKLSREEVWAAWVRLQLAGAPAAEFERLRERLTSLPE